MTRKENKRDEIRYFTNGSKFERRIKNSKK
jgi:hypothetical protein